MKKGIIDIYRIEVRATAQHPAIHRQAPTTENDRAPKVNGTEVGNPCCINNENFYLAGLLGRSTEVTLHQTRVRECQPPSFLGKPV